MPGLDSPAAAREIARVKRALIVEDLPAATAWLAESLGEAFPGVAVASAASVAAGREALASDVAPDIALVDLGLPDGSGVAVIAEIARLHPACHCVVTTIFADDVHLFPALRAGAHGYLLKDQPRDRIVAALRGIAAGEPPLSPVIARRLLRVFTPDVEAAPEVKLSPREREALTLIAKGCKLATVAELLGVTHNTAAGFLKSVYRKLNISSRAEATLAAARLGLVRTEL